MTSAGEILKLITDLLMVQKPSALSTVDQMKWHAETTWLRAVFVQVATGRTLTSREMDFIRDSLHLAAFEQKRSGSDTGIAAAPDTGLAAAPPTQTVGSIGNTAPTSPTGSPSPTPKEASPTRSRTSLLDFPSIAVSLSSPSCLTDARSMQQSTASGSDTTLGRTYFRRA